MQLPNVITTFIVAPKLIIINQQRPRKNNTFGNMHSGAVAGTETTQVLKALSEIKVSRSSQMVNKSAIYSRWDPGKGSMVCTMPLMRTMHY